MVHWNLKATGFLDISVETSENPGLCVALLRQNTSSRGADITSHTRICSYPAKVKPDAALRQKDRAGAENVFVRGYNYSILRARLGSIRSARRAGNNDADFLRRAGNNDADFLRRAACFNSNPNAFIVSLSLQLRIISVATQLAGTLAGELCQ